MGASVRIEDGAFSDTRYDRLAREAGLADADHARGKMALLWRQCTLEQRHVLPAEDVISVLGERGVDALVSARLGTVTARGIRIHGTKGRIEWLQNLRNNGRKGGRPRKPDGYPSGSTNQNPPAPAPAPAQEENPPTPQTGGSVKPGKRRRARKYEPTVTERSSVQLVLAKLNERTNRSYSPETAEHSDLIVALLRKTDSQGRPLYSEEDVRLVVWDRANRWAEDPKMEEYLRPSTLFGPQNFADYVVQARAAWARAAWAKSPDNPENRRAGQAAAVEGA